MGQGNDAAVWGHSDRGSIEGRLVGFDVASASLQPIHEMWLDDHVVPVLAAGGTIALTGLTSRSGSAARNSDLSNRRANAVLSHLRKKVTGPIGYNMGVTSVVGAGEAPAEAAGQQDGSEHPFYRAVIVLVWHKPTPPLPPQPKPKIEVEKKKRVTSRKWNKFNSRMYTEPGEIGGDLGTLAGEVLGGATKGGSDERTYAIIPADYVVTHVYEDLVVEDDLGIGVNTTTYKQTITYQWGPPTPQVFLRKRQKLVRNGMDHGWEIKEGYHSRSEIWKHTTSPDATVYW
jgi:hypothetical protein